MNAKELEEQWMNSRDWNLDYNRLIKEANKIGYKFQHLFGENHLPRSMAEVKKINKEIK